MAGQRQFFLVEGKTFDRLGGDYQQVFADTFNDVGINPLIALGTPAHNNGIVDTGFPFSNATIRQSGRDTLPTCWKPANATATLNVTSPTSGFVPGYQGGLFKQRDLGCNRINTVGEVT